MSSAPNPAVLIFPSGTDSYSIKVDRFAIISGESHVVPTTPYQLYLGHLPLQTSPSNVSIPGYVEVSGTPASFQFNIVYSGTSAGLTTFNAAQSLSGVSITYTSAGDILQSEFINSLQTSVTNVENYILANAATSGVVHTSGGTMTGNLVMNGGSILTTVSGGNNLGTAAIPFAGAYSNAFFGQTLKSDANNYLQFNSNGLKQKANTIRLEGGTDIYLTTSGSTIYLYATTISVSGSIIPTFSGFYNLGSPSNHFATLYVDNIVTPNGSGTFVHTSGDSMTGNLTMNGAAVVTDQIKSNTGAITINGNPVNIVSASNINLLPAPFGSVTGPSWSMTATSLQAGATIAPSIPSTFDLGASGNNFRTLYVDSIVGASLSGSFVRSSGDTMTGSLTIQPPASLNVATINSVFGSGVNINAPQINLQANSNIGFIVAGMQLFEVGAAQLYMSTSLLPTISGTYDIGSPSTPLASLFADNIHAKTVSGSTIISPTFSGTMSLASGASLVPGSSGNGNLGSSSSYFGTIYANNIVTSVTSGTYVSKFGDTMTGNLTLASGASIVSATSGTSNIGSPSNPIGTIYANSINTPSGGNLYVLKAGDTMSGPLQLNNINTPSGNLTLSGTVNLGIFAGTTISETAQQIDLTSTNGPIIIDANTELQLRQNGVLQLDINPSGIIAYGNMYPNMSGTLTLGTATNPYNTIYANNLVGMTSSGAFVSRTGDTMTGNLIFASGISLLSAVSGTSNLGSAANPFSTIYANNVVSPNLTLSGAFVHISGDTMTGPLFNNFISNAGAAYLTISGSVAEGSGTLASGFWSHAEGQGSIASSITSHAEGFLTVASGFRSHAEGNATTAAGSNSHAEGFSTIASGSSSHAEGSTTVTLGANSHAEGNFTTSFGTNSHAEGVSTIASGTDSHAEGNGGKALGNWSHVEGQTTIAYGVGAHAEGLSTIASGSYAHAEGNGSIAQGSGSHAEGSNSVASGDYSHAEGQGVAGAFAAHAEGGGTASGLYSHAEGSETIASATGAHAEGESTIASGVASHAGGNGSIAGGVASFAHGTNASALASGSFALNDSRMAGISNNLFNSMLLSFENGVTLASGTNITNAVSGINNLGSQSLPFSGIFANNINNGPIARSVFSEVPSGTIDSSNKAFTLLNIPYSGTERVYENGLRVTPSGLYSDFDYMLSANVITFFTAPVSGSKILVDYTHL